MLVVSDSSPIDGFVRVNCESGLAGQLRRVFPPIMDMFVKHERRLFNHLNHAKRVAATRPTIVAVAAIVAAILGGCTGERVFFPGDFGYDRQVRALRLTEDEAYQRATRAPKYEKPEHLGVRPPLIVAGWYGFTPIDKLDRSLRGYWVNGNTGEVEFRTANTRVWRRWPLADNKDRVYPSDWTSIEKISIPD